MYADDLVKPGAVVDLRADGITVAAALIDILDGTGLDVVFTAPGSASLVRRPAPPPVGNISGTVKDSLGQPVIAATLRVEGTQLGAVTDAEGRYRISGIRAGSQTITVRRIGYQLADQSGHRAGRRERDGGFRACGVDHEPQGTSRDRYDRCRRTNHAGRRGRVSGCVGRAKPRAIIGPWCKCLQAPLPEQASRPQDLKRATRCTCSFAGPRRCS